MKNAKYLVLALVASMILMGAGYAYWSDEISIKGTMKMGTMDVQWIDQAITTESALVDIEGDRITGDKNGVVFTVTNAYPGASFNGTVTMKNFGSIPARAKTVEFIGFDDTTLAPHALISIGGKTINVASGFGQGPFDISAQDIQLDALDTATGTFGVEFLGTAGNATQGKNLTLTVVITWEQGVGQPITTTP